MDVKSIIVGALIGAIITTIFNVFIAEPLKMRVNGQHKTNKKASQKAKHMDLVVKFLREWQTVEQPTTTQIQQSILSNTDEAYVFELLKELVRDGRIELISNLSSTTATTKWLYKK